MHATKVMKMDGCPEIPIPGRRDDIVGRAATGVTVTYRNSAAAADARPAHNHYLLGLGHTTVNVMKCSAPVGIGTGGEKLVERKVRDRHLCDLAVGSDAGLGWIGDSVEARFSRRRTS